MYLLTFSCSAEKRKLHTHYNRSKEFKISKLMFFFYHRASLIDFLKDSFSMVSLLRVEKDIVYPTLPYS